MKTPDQIREVIREKRCQSGSPFFRQLWAILASDLPKSAKLTAITILAHADAKGEVLAKSYPSVATLEVLTSQSRRGVQYDTEALEVRGWIKKTPGRGRISTRYAMMIPRTACELDERLRGAASCTPGGATHCTAEVQPVAPNLHTDRHNLSAQESERAASGPRNNSRTLREVFDDAQKLAAAMRGIDRNKLLGAPLFTDDGYALLAEMIGRYGYQHVREAIREVVGEIGSPLRRGQVRTWKFFEMRANSEYVDIPKGA